MKQTKQTRQLADALLTCCVVACLAATAECWKPRFGWQFDVSSQNGTQPKLVAKPTILVTAFATRTDESVELTVRVSNVSLIGQVAREFYVAANDSLLRYFVFEDLQLTTKIRGEFRHATHVFVALSNATHTSGFVKTDQIHFFDPVRVELRTSWSREYATVRASKWLANDSQPLNKLALSYCNIAAKCFDARSSDAKPCVDGQFWQAAVEPNQEFQLGSLRNGKAHRFLVKQTNERLSFEGSFVSHEQTLHSPNCSPQLDTSIEFGVVCKAIVLLELFLVVMFLTFKLTEMCLAHFSKVNE